MSGSATRGFLVLTVAAVLGLGGCASWSNLWAPPPETARPILAEHALGRADAPVRVVAYVSFTCPHCRDWEETVFPAFRARFIDTGRVRFIQRELPTPPVNASVAAVELTRCAAEERYFAMSNALFGGQGALRASGDAEAWLTAAGKVGGLSAGQVEACLDAAPSASDAAALAARAAENGVSGTPAFLVNGERLQDRSLNGLEAAIVAAEGP